MIHVTLDKPRWPRLMRWTVTINAVTAGGTLTARARPRRGKVEETVRQLRTAAEIYVGAQGCPQ